MNMQSSEKKKCILIRFFSFVCVFCLIFIIWYANVDRSIVVLYAALTSMWQLRLIIIIKYHQYQQYGDKQFHFVPLNFEFWYLE